MNDFDYFEFCKEQYANEVNRKNEISNSFSISIGLISVLVVALYYLITAFDYTISNTLSITHVLLFTIVLCFLTLSIIQLIKFFSNYPKGYTYAYLENSDELEHYREQLLAYYKNNEVAVNKELKDHLLDYLVKANTVNQINNDKKIKHRVKCHNHLIVSFIGICSLLIPFAINYGIQSSENEVQQIEIVRRVDKKNNNQIKQICRTKMKKVKEVRANQNLRK